LPFSIVNKLLIIDCTSAYHGTDDILRHQYNKKRSYPAITLIWPITSTISAVVQQADNSSKSENLGKGKENGYHSQ